MQHWTSCGGKEFSMRPKGSAELLEYRRHRALALLDEGRSLREVAHLVGSNASSVLRWRNAREHGGAEALKVKFSPGRPSKLTVVQRRKLIRLLLRGAIAYGHQTELWTTARIARLVEREFAVCYHSDHVGRLLHELGWSHQKPERRALERDADTFVRWKRLQWPRLKKTLHGWAPTSSSPMNPVSN
jgi:transposase